MSNESLTASGWRVPFVIGAACALVGLYLRRGIDETPAFEASRDTAPPKNLLRELLHYPRELLTVVGLTLGGTVGFYTYTTYMQKFLVNTVGLQIDDATLLSAGTLFLFICLQPVVGALSDRVGRRPVLISFGVLGSLFTVPILTLLSRTTSAWDAFLLLMGALVIVSGYTAISAIVKAELFPAQIRALGVGLPFALTVSLFGGTAEYVALWLKSIGQEPLFYWYVSACIAVSLAVYTLMPEPQRHSRIDTEPPERA